jgi:hypothetical protein
MTRALFASLLASFAIAAAPSAASADLLGLNNPVTDWSSLLPSLSPQYTPNDPNICNSGKPKCLDALSKEMTKRYQPLSDSCSHNVMFALLYLRVTDHVADAVWTPGRFTDPYFMTHYAAVFANLYFKGYDAWARTDPTAPVAWQIALDAAKGKQVTALGNLLLGMNAHINRDLPFVLWQIGLVKPDGTSRKPDHDKVNEFLNRVDLFGEANRRFDSSIDPNQAPGAIHSIIVMREQAWRNAERLRAAENDPVAFAMVKESIEQSAYAAALAIKASGTYGLGQSTATRDAYCAVHHDDV